MFDQELIESGIICDPYAGGALRFLKAPVVIDSAFERALYDVSERVARVYDELAHICRLHPSLLDTFFALTPCQKLMWLASCPLWHVHARADVFDTDEGLRITELNSDTPTGQPEAIVLGELALKAHVTPEGPVPGVAGRRGLRDPNAQLLSSLLDAMAESAKRRVPRDLARTVGIVYPTDLTEDIPLLRLYESAFAARGYKTVLGSPHNLSLDEAGRASMFGIPFGLCVRHYKTDWWGERVPAFRDDLPFDDPFPLAGPLRVLVEAEMNEKLVVVNPLGAVLTQNKRTMAFLWEEKSRFSTESQRTIENHVPYTQRLESIHREKVAAERESWVLKSDYGAEGDEVFIGAEMSAADWHACIMQASEDRFIVQQKFAPRRDAAGNATNFGVYLAGGKAAGLYARAEPGSPGNAAASVAVLVRE